MLSYAGVAQSMKRSAGATKELGSLLTAAFVAAITMLVRKCGGDDVEDQPKAKAWLQEHADNFFAGETPDPPRGFTQCCRDHGIRGRKEQKRAWLLYLNEGFREADNAAAMLSDFRSVGSTLGEDAAAVPPEPAPTDSVASPPPPFNGDPPKKPKVDNVVKGETEPFNVVGGPGPEDADRMAEEEARRDVDELDRDPPGDGSSSSSSSHP